MGAHSPSRALRRSWFPALAATTLLASALATPVLLASAAHASAGVSGAVQTTNSTGSQVNGNIYALKTDVYLNGGSNTPAAHRLAAGDYFFAVLEPGGQRDPNDGTAGNLSQDAAPARSFTAHSDGTVSPTGESAGHAFAGGLVQLADFDDTSNPGGEYIVAVCTYVSDGNGGAASVTPASCKYDAFKVRESVMPCTDQCVDVTPPSGTKTATPTHQRTVKWSIGKTANPTSFQQLTAGTSTYQIKATKTVTGESWSVAGTITVSNPNTGSLPVTVSDTALYDVTTSSAGPSGALCTVLPPVGDPSGSSYADGSASGTVPGAGQAQFGYSCTLGDPGTDTYQNTAQIGWTDGANQPQLVATENSGSFDFSAVTELGDPETVTVYDTFTGTGSPGLTGTPVSDTTTVTYSRAFFNSNCQTYPNTASLSTGPTAQASVTFCGPNAGGLTMGWWQNSNGQALLKANLTSACGRLNGYVGSHTLAADLVNASNKSTGLYAPSGCTGPASGKSYLPTFTYNVVKAANASGSGTPMELGQWLTTALNTANYASYTSAGRPTLAATLNVANPAGLLGLPTCTSVGSLLSGAVNSYSAYSGTKATVTALLTLFDNINNNRAQTC